MYTKDDVINQLSGKQKGEMVTIEFMNDVKLNKKNKWTKQVNRFYNNVKKYHKLKCVTTYNYEEELKKRCEKNGNVFEGLKGGTWGKSINENPYIIYYINEKEEENYYLQVVPVELLEYYYLLNNQQINENILKPYLPQKDDYGVVIRIKLKDIILVN